MLVMENKSTVAISARDNAVMMELDDGEGHAIRLSIDAHDVGRMLSVCAGLGRCSVCSNNLVVELFDDDSLNFTWRDRENEVELNLSPDDVFVFEETLKSYCPMLMRPEKGKVVRHVNETATGVPCMSDATCNVRIMENVSRISAEFMGAIAVLLWDMDSSDIILNYIIPWAEEAEEEFAKSSVAA